MIDLEQLEVSVKYWPQEREFDLAERVFIWAYFAASISEKHKDWVLDRFGVEGGVKEFFIERYLQSNELDDEMIRLLGYLLPEDDEDYMNLYPRTPLFVRQQAKEFASKRYKASLNDLL